MYIRGLESVDGYGYFVTADGDGVKFVTPGDHRVGAFIWPLEGSFGTVGTHKDVRTGYEVFELERLPRSVRRSLCGFEYGHVSPQPSDELGGVVVFRSRSQKLSWKSYRLAEHHFNHCCIEVLVSDSANADEDGR